MAAVPPLAMGKNRVDHALAGDERPVYRVCAFVEGARLL
jgi:hypothetical protein